MPDNKILIADCDTHWVNTLKNYLAAAGYNVIATNEARDALGKVFEEHPDLVILDAVMPEIDGFQVCQEIKEKYRDTVIIFVTVMDKLEYKLKAFSLGATDYLIKPVNLEELSARISAHLKTKDIEEQLKESEKQYRLIFENSAVGITVADKNESLVIWNKFTETLLGASRHDLLLKPVSALYPKEEWERMRSENVRQRGFQHHFETKMYKKNGELMDVDISLSVVKDDTGNIIASIGIIRDITQRKIAEGKLVDSEYRFRTVFENSAVAIMTADCHEYITAWNKFTEDLLGMHPADLLMKPVVSLYPPEEWKRMRRLNVRQKGMRHHFETKMYGKSGKTIDVDISITVLKDHSGNITGSIGIIRDISVRKRVERVLLSAKEAAEAANRTKGRFLHRLSCEVIRPMRVVTKMLSWVLKTELSDKQQRALRRVKLAADKTKTLLDEIHFVFQELKDEKFFKED